MLKNTSGLCKLPIQKNNSVSIHLTNSSKTNKNTINLKQYDNKIVIFGSKNNNSNQPLNINDSKININGDDKQTKKNDKLLIKQQNRENYAKIINDIKINLTERIIDNQSKLPVTVNNPIVPRRNQNDVKNYNYIQTNSCYNIKQFKSVCKDSSVIEFEESTEKKDNSKLMRCDTVILFPNKLQKIIIQTWFTACIDMYNEGLRHIKGTFSQDLKQLIKVRECKDANPSLIKEKKTLEEERDLKQKNMNKRLDYIKNEIKTYADIPKNKRYKPRTKSTKFNKIMKEYIELRDSLKELNIKLHELKQKIDKNNKVINNYDKNENYRLDFNTLRDEFLRKKRFVISNYRSYSADKRKSINIIDINKNNKKDNNGKKYRKNVYKKLGKRKRKLLKEKEKLKLIEANKKNKKDKKHKKEEKETENEKIEKREKREINEPGYIIYAHIMDCAIRDACANYKSALTNFFRHNNDGFRLKPRRHSDIKKTFEVEMQYLKNNQICENMWGKIKMVYCKGNKWYPYKFVPGGAVKIQYNSELDRYTMFAPRKIVPANSLVETSEKVVSENPDILTNKKIPKKSKTTKSTTKQAKTKVITKKLIPVKKSATKISTAKKPTTKSTTKKSTTKKSTTKKSPTKKTSTKKTSTKKTSTKKSTTKKSITNKATKMIKNIKESIPKKKRYKPRKQKGIPTNNPKKKIARKLKKLKAKNLKENDTKLNRLPNGNKYRRIYRIEQNKTARMQARKISKKLAKKKENAKNKKLKKDSIPSKKSFIGLDPGIRTFMTGVSDKSIEKLGCSMNKKIKKLLKRIDNAKNVFDPIKRKERERRCSKKISNIVDETHWKIIKYLTDNYATIFIGRFNIKSAVSTKNKNQLSDMTKRIGLRMKHYEFRQKLKYKCRVKGCKFVEVDERCTSKTCSLCGAYDDKLGASETYNCKSCKGIIDRDMNGSRCIILKNSKRLRKKTRK
jgi:transposase